MRVLLKTITTIGFLVPIAASALGIGEIRLHSGLNQPLDAEIPLIVSGTDTVGEVKANLAPSEAFNIAGIERDYHLTRLKFKPVQTPDGSYIIRVTSQEVMHEPFLTFLMEVRSPQGRALKEFTVLLDPPPELQDDTYAETSPTVVHRQRYHEPNDEKEYSDEYSDDRTSSRRAIRARTATTGPESLSIPPPSDSQIMDRTYGPVHRGETLWNIAQGLARDLGVSPDRIVTGLFHANPAAFHGSANSLQAGATLRIPNSDYLTHIPSRQTSDKDQAALEGSPHRVIKFLPLSDNSAHRESPTSGGSPTGITEKSEVASAILEGVRRENEEFRVRLLQLEQKLEAMQRMLTAKDEQITSLKTRPTSESSSKSALVPEGESPTPVTSPPLVANKSQPSVTPEAPPTKTESSTVPTTSVVPPEDISTKEPPKPETSAPSAETGVKTSPSKPADTKKSPPSSTKARPPRATTPTQEPESSINPIYLGAGVFGTLGIAGLAWWLIQRRRNMLIAQTESILLAVERESLQSSLTAAARATDSGLEPIVSTRSSFLSEFTPSDFDALGSETDDVDPISEADVYLAYGRYKQAEELIRHAITQYPDRDECKLKLLEIYQATENRAAFESYAQELKAAKKDTQSDFWAKVSEIGRELAPGNPLFQTAGGAGSRSGKSKSFGGSASTNGSMGVLDLSDDLIDDLKNFEIGITEPTATKKIQTEDKSDSLFSFDFDLGMDTEEEDIPVLPTPASPDTASRLVPLQESPTSKPSSVNIAKAEKPKEPPPTVPEENASLDFDVGLLQLDKKKDISDTAKQSAVLEEEPELDNLIAFDFTERKTASKPLGKSTPSEKTATETTATFDDLLKNLGPTKEPEKSKKPKLDIDLELFEIGSDLPGQSKALPDTPTPYEETNEIDLSSLIKEEKTLTQPKAKVGDGYGLLSLDEVEELPSARTDHSYAFLDPETEDAFLESETEENKPSVFVEESSSEKNPFLTLDFDLDASPSSIQEEIIEVPLIPIEEEIVESDSSENGDFDQYETKLDLARAYADMEDEESARDILQEVLSGGNSRQRKDATVLLRQLGHTTA